jgi:hypothetical protein
MGELIFSISDVVLCVEKDSHVGRGKRDAKKRTNESFFLIPFMQSCIGPKQFIANVAGAILEQYKLVGNVCKLAAFYCSYLWKHLTNYASTCCLVLW